jgi:hypothetical protein
VAASPFALRPGDPAARLGSPSPVLEARAPGPRLLTPVRPEPLEQDPGLDWADQAGRTRASLGSPAYNVGAKLDSLDVYAAMTPRPLERLRQAFGPRWMAAGRRYATTHVVVGAPDAKGHRSLYDLATAGGVRVDSGSGGYEIWSVPHREWASFAPAILTVPDEEAAVQATVEVVDAGSPAVVVEARSRFDAAPGRVLSIARGLETVRVEAEAEADATLVLADAWWPGWEARIDGAVTPLYRADALVRAVRWPAGRHLLELRYRPPEVRAGILLSWLGLAILAGGIAWLRHRAADPTRR